MITQECECYKSDNCKQNSNKVNVHVLGFDKESTDRWTAFQLDIRMYIHSSRSLTMMISGKY